jgi:hypothetical protein
MPSPLHFSEEKDLLLALAQPIGQRCGRSSLPPSAKSSRPCGQARQPRRHARGCAHDPTRIAQRVAALPQRLNGEVQRWNTTGEAAIYRCRASWLFSHRPALGS